MVADGSTMAMASPGVASAGAFTLSKPSESPDAATLGPLLVAVGIAVLTFLGLRRFVQLRGVFQSQISRPPTRINRWRKNPVIHAYSVNLDSLGICRT